MAKACLCKMRAKLGRAGLATGRDAASRSLGINAELAALIEILRENHTPATA
jgi:hypothetical protein